jgi:hypothetical protein
MFPCSETKVVKKDYIAVNKNKTASHYLFQSNLWGTPNIPMRRILSPCKRQFFNTRSTLLAASRGQEPIALVDSQPLEDTSAISNRKVF